MTEKRITINIEKADEAISDWADEHIDTYRSGVLGVDEIGVYHMYYKSRHDIITFEDVKTPCPNCLHGWRRDTGPNGSDEECFTCNTTGFV